MGRDPRFSRAGMREREREASKQSAVEREISETIEGVLEHSVERIF